jgi:hypothetical protein
MRNKHTDVLQEHGMIPKYYTLGKVTVCTLFDKRRLKVEARGLSICSPNDFFDIAQGKKWALRRAIKALLSKEQLEPICPRRFHTIRDGHIIGYAHLDKVRALTMDYKAEYQPEPWDCEIQTIKKLKARRKETAARIKAEKGEA